MRTRPRTKYSFNPVRFVLCYYSSIDGMGRNSLAPQPSARLQPGTGPPLEVIEVGRG